VDCDKTIARGQTHHRCADCMQEYNQQHAMMKQERERAEMNEKYVLPPSSPSSSHSFAASSSSSSSAATVTNASDHGKVCNAHICPTQMLLLMNLHVLLFHSVVCALRLRAALAGQVRTHRLREAGAKSRPTVSQSLPLASPRCKACACHSGS